MKKIAIFALSVIMAIGLVGCSSGGVTQAEYDKVVFENKDLKESLKKATEIAQKYVDEASEAIDGDIKNMMYEATAKTLDENATCVSISDKIIQITVPMGDKSLKDFSDSLQAAAYSVGISLDEDKYTTCIIMFLDNDGNCAGGFSCGLDRDVTSFIGVQP